MSQFRLSRAVQNLMIQKDWATSWCAVQFGLTEPYIKSILNGVITTMTQNQMQKVANRAGISLSEFVRLGEE